MVGEIGGNDYNAALAQDIPVDQITKVFVPSVVGAISSGITVSLVTLVILVYEHVISYIHARSFVKLTSPFES